ncbi:hypothetical protein WG66_004955 [Moniliophthora roreri]|nr:hypothetical protein WG66_004955 [Moniliophthora roreri]
MDCEDLSERESAFEPSAAREMSSEPGAHECAGSWCTGVDEHVRVTCAQVYTYILVACHHLYTVTVFQYVTPQLPLVAPLFLLNGLTGFLEHSWLIRRLYVFSRNTFLTLICCILALACFMTTIAAVAFQRPTFLEYIAKWWWLTTCTDVSISAMSGC